MRRRTRHVPGGLAAVLLLYLAAGAPAGPEPVTADLAWVVAEDYAGFSSLGIALTDRPPAGVAAVEDSGPVRYHRRNLPGGAALLLAVRLVPEPSWIRVDRDFDGDLRDEEPFRFAGSATVRTAVVRVPLALGGETREAGLRFMNQSTGSGAMLTMTVPVRREGAVVLAGRLRAVALTDGDGDLAFDGPGDALLLDVDGDVELDSRNPSRDRLVPGTPFRLGDHGWVARLEADGRVVFEPLEGPAPPTVVAWPRYGTPARGTTAGGEATPLADLLAEYAEAGKRDLKQGATAYGERSQVVNRLGRVGTPEAFRELMRLFDAESDRNLRAAILRATGYREYAPFAARLFGIARDEGEPNLATAAVTALGGMDAPGFGGLVLDLVRNAKDDSVFSTAARYLGYERTPEARALLAEKARADPSPSRRRHAYEAAARYGDGPPPEDLVRLAAKAEDPWHRALGLEHAFLVGLPDARDLALAALGSTEERVLTEAVRILGALGDAAAVKAVLSMADPPPAVDRRATTLLRAVRDDEAVAALIGALSDRRPRTRLLAAAILGGHAAPAVLDALSARVREEKDPEVVAALLRALGAQEPGAAATAILKAAAAARKNPDALAAALDALARLGFARPDVHRFFEQLAASREILERLLAVEAAGKSGAPEAADLALGVLADPEWRVRLAAARALGRVRVKRAVPALIDRLEKEELPRVREAVADTLFLVTGRNYYDMPGLWRKWWEEEGEGFEVPERIPERPEEAHGGASAATFYGVPVNSDRIIFVIDQSGSMSSASGGRTNLERAVEETIAVVEKLPKAARVNVILFETAIHPWQKQLVPVGQARAALAKHLRAQKPTGGTNLYDGLEMALLTKDVDTIYLLSDGSPGSGKFVAHEDILREVASLNRVRKIAIHCVAVGFDSPLLKELAAQNDGRYVRR